MEAADFEVVIEPRDDPGPAGAERVELMLAANPGVPAVPIRQAASGGELSRVMLALMTVAVVSREGTRSARTGAMVSRGTGSARTGAMVSARGRARPGSERQARVESRTLVFDEVDAGVGGQTARAVGERLRALGESRQVLCITHLPQIAALADTHFRIEKSAEGRPRSPRSRRSRATASSRSSCGCWAPRPATGRRAGTPRSCWRRPERRLSSAARPSRLGFPESLMPQSRPETRFIFVTGGVVSALGKGIAAASLGQLLVARGLSVTIQKFDPYINVDPGTMSPFQHGEVFVTEDGAETDLDLGHYERFTDVKRAAPRTPPRVRSTTP